MDYERRYVGMRRNPLTVIVLSIVTCNIYGIYWLYTVGREVNGELGREAVNPLLSLLGIICFPFTLYYLYVLDQALVQISNEKKLNYQTNFILWVVLTFLAGAGMFFAYFQVQTCLNSLWDANESNVRLQ